MSTGSPPGTRRFRRSRQGPRQRRSCSQSAWRDGVDPTKTERELREAAILAAEKAEKDKIKALNASTANATGAPLSKKKKK